MYKNREITVDKEPTTRVGRWWYWWCVEQQGKECHPPNGENYGEERGKGNSGRVCRNKQRGEGNAGGTMPGTTTQPSPPVLPLPVCLPALPGPAASHAMSNSPASLMDVCCYRQGQACRKAKCKERKSHASGRKCLQGRWGGVYTGREHRSWASLLLQPRGMQEREREKRCCCVRW